MPNHPNLNVFPKNEGINSSRDKCQAQDYKNPVSANACLKVADYESGDGQQHHVKDIDPAPEPVFSGAFIFITDYESGEEGKKSK